MNDLTPREASIAHLANIFGCDTNKISIPREFIYLTSSLNKAVILKQLAYWATRPNSIKNSCFYKTHHELGNEVCLTMRQAQRAVEALVADFPKLFTICQPKKVNNTPKMHYKINFIELSRLLVKSMKDRVKKELSTEHKKTPEPGTIINIPGSDNLSLSQTLQQTVKKEIKKVSPQNVDNPNQVICVIPIGSKHDRRDYLIKRSKMAQFEAAFQHMDITKLCRQLGEFVDHGILEFNDLDDLSNCIQYISVYVEKNNALPEWFIENMDKLKA